MTMEWNLVEWLKLLLKPLDGKETDQCAAARQVASGEISAIRDGALTTWLGDSSIWLAPNDSTLKTALDSWLDDLSTGVLSMILGNGDPTGEQLQDLANLISSCFAEWNAADSQQQKPVTIGRRGERFTGIEPVDPGVYPGWFTAFDTRDAQWKYARTAGADVLPSQTDEWISQAFAFEQMGAEQSVLRAGFTYGPDGTLCLATREGATGEDVFEYAKRNGKFSAVLQVLNTGVRDGTAKSVTFVKGADFEGLLGRLPEFLSSVVARCILRTCEQIAAGKYNNNTRTFDYRTSTLGIGEEIEAPEFTANVTAGCAGRWAESANWQDLNFSATVVLNTTDAYLKIKKYVRRAWPYPGAPNADPLEVHLLQGRVFSCGPADSTSPELAQLEQSGVGATLGVQTGRVRLKTSKGWAVAVVTGLNTDVAKKSTQVLLGIKDDRRIVFR